jgi:hypothetical protein
MAAMARFIRLIFCMLGCTALSTPVLGAQDSATGAPPSATSGVATPTGPRIEDETSGNADVPLTPPPRATAAAPGGNNARSVEVRPSREIDEDLRRLRSQIDGLQSILRADITTMRPTWWERLIPVAIGLAGVLVGGLLGWLQQGRQLKVSTQLQQQQLQENERIGRAKAGHESLSKVVDYQTQQVNEFYSPLRLMLRRSSGVRRQLTDQLHEKNGQRYVYVRQSDGRDHLFVLGEGGARARFRLIEHMHELATQHAELMPLVREIVSIGVTMATLIDTKGGYALNSDRLDTLLGRYLAHFSILRDVAEKADKNPALLAALRYNVAYPVELDEALDDDMKVLTDQITDWKELSRQMWAEAQTPNRSESKKA